MGIVRNTYGELKNTTLKTWLDWFPEEQYGKMTWSRPMLHEIRSWRHRVGRAFLRFDDEADLAKMRSLEMTGWWFNEGEYISNPSLTKLKAGPAAIPP